MTTLSKDDYRQILKDELQSRAELNNQYSMRAFARDLDVSFDFLSRVLRYQRGFSKEVAAKVCKKLRYSEKKTELFCSLVMASDARSKKTRLQAVERVKLLKESFDERYELELDRFQLISDWYHAAILELSALKDFQSEPEWIACRLSLTPELVKEALERLQRLNLLEEVEGQLRRVNSEVKTPTDRASEAIRNHHRQIIEKAEKALDGQAVEERDFQSLTMAISTKDIPLVKKRLLALRKELLAKTGDNLGDKDEVYCLSTQFFRLS